MKNLFALLAMNLPYYLSVRDNENSSLTVFVFAGAASGVVGLSCIVLGCRYLYKRDKKQLKAEIIRLTMELERMRSASFIATPAQDPRLLASPKEVVSQSLKQKVNPIPYTIEGEKDIA